MRTRSRPTTHAQTQTCEHVAVRGIKTKNCRERAAEKRNPTSEAQLPDASGAATHAGRGGLLDAPVTASGAATHRWRGGLLDAPVTASGAATHRWERRFAGRIQSPDASGAATHRWERRFAGRIQSPDASGAATHRWERRFAGRASYRTHPVQRRIAGRGGLLDAPVTGRIRCSDASLGEEVYWTHPFTGRIRRSDASLGEEVYWTRQLPDASGAATHRWERRFTGRASYRTHPVQRRIAGRGGLLDASSHRTHPAQRRIAGRGGLLDAPVTGRIRCSDASLGEEVYWTHPATASGAATHRWERNGTGRIQLPDAFGAATHRWERRLHMASPMRTHPMCVTRPRQQRRSSAATSAPNGARRSS
jgi:hypothetical protein